VRDAGIDRNMIATKGPAIVQGATAAAGIDGPDGVLRTVTVVADKEMPWNRNMSLMYSGEDAFPLDAEKGLFLEGTYKHGFTAGLVDASTLNTTQWEMVNGRLGLLDTYDQPGVWHDIKSGFDSVFGIQANNVMTPKEAEEYSLLTQLKSQHTRLPAAELLGPDFQMQPTSAVNQPVNSEVWNDEAPAGATVFDLANRKAATVKTAISAQGWRDLFNSLSTPYYNAAMGESGHADMVVQPNVAQTQSGLRTLGAAVSMGVDAYGNTLAVGAGSLMSTAARVGNTAGAGPSELYRLGKSVAPMERTYEHALSPQLYLEDLSGHYGINLRGSGQPVSLLFDESLPAGQLGVTRAAEGGRVIRIGPDALVDEATAANTIAHELSHARDYLRGNIHKPHGTNTSVGDGSVYGSGNALEEWIKGKR
jgi:hypothetical protein